METIKTKNGKSKTAFLKFFFILKLWKWFVSILSLKQPNLEERISAVYKYSSRLLTKNSFDFFMTGLLPLKF